MTSFYGWDSAASRLQSHYIVCTPPPLSAEWDGLNLLPNFQKGGLDTNLILSGGGGVTFLRRSLQFLHKI